jgi:hypothetical protein
MTFVPGYEYDVFISYAHVDDSPLFDATVGREQPSGWVATLVRHLKNELAEKIGRSEAFDVWFDTHKLRGNQLTEEIAEKLKRSATFSAILSPGYLASTWCRAEARLFTRHFAHELDRRIFVVEKAPQSLLPELSGRPNYRFWYRDSADQMRTFAKPAPHRDEIEYFRRIEDLARDIHSQLTAMVGGPAYFQLAEPDTFIDGFGGPINGGPTVLLAEVTDDLEPMRSQVKRYLEQGGVLVLPTVSYPLGRTEFETALEADLRRSNLFVQLLGPTPGKLPRDVPDGYGWLQLDCARRVGARVIQWRSSDLDLDSVEHPRHRELIQLETVHATSLESFKRAISAALAPPDPAVASRRDTSGPPLVFLNAEPRHRAIAVEIRAGIGDRAAWAEPLLTGSSRTLRKDFEQTVIACDAMVVVYADNPSWARTQLLEFHKLTPRRARPVRAIPVIDAPPEDKPELGIYNLPKMEIINSRHGVGQETLTRLSACLRL